MRQAGDWGRARRRAGDHRGWRDRLPGGARRSDAARYFHRGAAGGPGAFERDGSARQAARRARISLQWLREITEKNPARTMRILNVTETYAPFLEFGGPPVKVRALSEGLARRGHQVTVLTADWGLEKRLQTAEEKITAERSPFGWRWNENGVQAIYVPTWLHYRRVSWNPAVKRYCRARLQNFDVVHIFGLYDLLGPVVAAASRKRNLPYVLEPIGMFVPMVRNLWLKRMYHAAWGRRLLEGASAVIATSDQEAGQRLAGGLPRARLVARRNGVEVPATWPARGTFRKARSISAEEKLVLFLGRLSAKKSPDLLLRACAAPSGGATGTSMTL